MSSVLDDVIVEVEPSLAVVSAISEVKPAILLSLDVGTSGVRAALFDEFGREISGAQVSNRRNLSSVPDFAELDAHSIVEQVSVTIDELLARYVETATRIELVSISTFWHSLIGVDSVGYPTTPLLSWADTRGARMAKNLRERFDEHEIHSRTGCRFHPSFWPANYCG